MKLHYKIFGKHTGLRVSEFSLGTGMFGTQWGYGAEPEEARRIFDAYAEAGGNFIDTADGYQFGQSEQLVGEFLGAERDNFVVATKYTGGAVAEGGVSATGNSRKNMIRSAEASLRRLGTDRIDLYWVHFPDAPSLTRAPHIIRNSTPVTARFSSSTGLPQIPDNDPNANPRGLAIRFHLAEHVHTDIVSHSTDGFPTRTGQEFLEFLRAAASSDPAKPSPSPIEVFLAGHPKALAFVQTPKPSPSSFARESYFGVTALRFTNKDGVSRYGRYRITPEEGTEHLDDATAKTQGANYLFDELTERIARGPISFQILVQVANDTDIVDDATVHWPEERPLINLGRMVITNPVSDNAREQKKIIFDPIPRVDGIEPSDDPLLELRAAIYLLSGRRRRQAPET